MTVQRQALTKSMTKACSGTESGSSFPLNVTYGTTHSFSSFATHSEPIAMSPDSEGQDKWCFLLSPVSWVAPSRVHRRYSAREAFFLCCNLLSHQGGVDYVKHTFLDKGRGRLFPPPLFRGDQHHTAHDYHTGHHNHNFSGINDTRD